MKIFSSIGRHFRQAGVAYLVLVISLSLTVGAYYRVTAIVKARDQARFEHTVREHTAAITERVTEYVGQLQAVRALFTAREVVSAEEWQRFVESLEMPRRYPGILSVSYLPRVNAADKERFVRSLRGIGKADSRLLPEGDRPVYFPVQFTASFDKAATAVPGQDHLVAPERREAMERAAETGQPVATGLVSFLGDSTNEERGGFVIYLPVCAPGTSAEAEHRKTQCGYISTCVKPSKMLEGLFGDPAKRLLALKVYDGLTSEPAHLMHDEASSDSDASAGQNPSIVQTSEVPALNRVWSVQFSTLPLFYAESHQNLPVLVLYAGTAVSILFFVMMLIPVSARTRSERMADHLRKSEAALAAQKERLSITVDSLREGVITTDKSGRVVSINEAGRRLTGFPKDEAVGKHIDEVFQIVHEKTRERRLSPVESNLRVGGVAGHENPTMLVARDGTERPVSDSAVPIYGESGETNGAVIVFRDITEEQKTEAELLRESKLESVGLLAGGIAHDYNNVLTGIIGNISLARMSSHSAQAMLDRLNAVEKAAMRAKELTQQLLTFAKGGAPVRRPVQPANLIKEATQFVLHGRNVESEFSLPADLWFIEVDEGQIRQIVNNIVINSVQAMPKGGRVKVKAENVEVSPAFLPTLKGGKYVKLSFTDNGPGIAPEHLPRVFDPYFTTKKNGSGLGLATAYSVVKKHEGYIEAESRPGAGTTIRIHLPAVLKPATSEPPPDTEQNRLFGHGRILVMDDEPEILMVVSAMLEISGYEVEKAKDGTEALEVYQAAQKQGRPFSVVIMDLTIPNGMGGKEAVQRLKAIDPNVRAIVSSGYSYDPVMADFRKFGFNGVMPKPYRMDELTRVLKEVIGSNGDEGGKGGEAAQPAVKSAAKPIM